MFKKENWFKILLWIIAFLIVWTCVASLVSLPSTIANVFGVALLLAATYVSVKTECFTKISFKFNFKKNRNNEEIN